jgi:GT2 family glycosyltransferase
MHSTVTTDVMVSIIVKALNEERRIGACLEAALMAVQGIDAEVVLVDSISADRTVTIAATYPIRIVQFVRAEDRGCGAAVELGWRYARGRFVYILDADMQIQPSFVREALDYLLKNENVAAVGGVIRDTQLKTLADSQRHRAAAFHTEIQSVTELGGGGLYRRSAVEQSGYLAHQSLAAYEEAELGARLRSSGWRLVRLPNTAVLHEGHDETNWQMLLRLWANGRAKSPAIFLRTSVGKPWFTLTLRKLAHIVFVPLGHTAALVSALIVAWFAGAIPAVVTWTGFWLACLVSLSVTKRSPRVALWHLFLWHYWAAGTLAGMRDRAKDPLAPIAATELVAASQPPVTTPPKLRDAHA